MTAIQTREQFLGLVHEAERHVSWLAQSSSSEQQQLWMLVTAHLAFVRATLADGSFPTVAQKQAVHLGAAAAHLAPGRDGRYGNDSLAWLHAVLPMLEEYYRAMEPPVAPPQGAPARGAREPPAQAAEPAATGASSEGETRDWAHGVQVVVSWPNGSRYLGFVRLVHEQSYLVAFGNGQQQWLRSADLAAGPRPGDPVAAACPGGEVLRGTIVELSEGRYLVELGGEHREWLDWTAIQPV